MAIEGALKILKKIRYFGWKRYCPVCKSRLRLFEPFGVVERTDALCPICHSLERHRLVWIFLNHQTSLFDGSPKRMLHIAPEPQFEEKFREIPTLDYLTLDRGNPGAGINADITDIPFSDDSFDIIYCSHVLEHVDDDRKALFELSRVLNPDGWVVILVPIISSTTYEDPTVTKPEDREKVYGHPEHVRNYGSDFKTRLEESGFSVTVFSSTDIVDKRNIIRLGVKQEIIFLCNKSIDLEKSSKLKQNLL